MAFAVILSGLGLMAEAQSKLLRLAFEGKTDQIKKLIQGGNDVNISDDYGRTALMLAASRGHIDTVHLLLENGAVK